MNRLNQTETVVFGLTCSLYFQVIISLSIFTDHNNCRVVWRPQNVSPDIHIYFVFTLSALWDCWAQTLRPEIHAVRICMQNSIRASVRIDSRCTCEVFDTGQSWSSFKFCISLYSKCVESEYVSQIRFGIVNSNFTLGGLPTYSGADQLEMLVFVS